MLQTDHLAAVTVTISLIMIVTVTWLKRDVKLQLTTTTVTWNFAVKGWGGGDIFGINHSINKMQ